MGYTLRAAISAGRIDSDSLGSFEIRDGELEAEDYATATALVEEYNVEWPNGDPGPGDLGADDDVTSDAVPDESDGGDEDEEDVVEEPFNARGFVDRTPMATVIDDIESGEYDEYLDAIEDAAKRQGVQNTVDNRRGD